MFSAALIALAAAALVGAQSSAGAEDVTMTVCAGAVGDNVSKCALVYHTGSSVVVVATTITAPTPVETTCIGDGCYVVYSSDGTETTEAITMTSVAATGTAVSSAEDVFSGTGTETVCAGPDCWEIYSTGGGWAKVPITRTTAYATAVGSSAPMQTAGAVAESGSDHTLSVILPAVLGTVGGLLVLVLGVILFLRYRTRKAAPSREWVNNPKLNFEGTQAQGAREMSQADVDGLRHSVV